VQLRSFRGIFVQLSGFKSNSSLLTHSDRKMAQLNEHLMLPTHEFQAETERKADYDGSIIHSSEQSAVEVNRRRSWRMAFVDLQILALLHSQQLTGYSIRKNLNARFGILISFGTLYPRLKFLERIQVLKSIIVSRSPHSPGVVTYELTEKGVEDLRTGLVTYQNSLLTMRQILNVEIE
jgi:DNA-binding PadR family transcriptional regulator